MAGDQIRDDLLDAVGVGLGQEADVAGIDAHQGDVPFAGDLEGAQDRAVAAEHQHEVDAVGAVRADRLNTSGAQCLRGPGHGAGRGSTGPGDGDGLVVELALQQHDTRDPPAVLPPTRLLRGPVKSGGVGRVDGVGRPRRSTGV